MAKRDLVIIGGGAAGLVVASVASQLGLKVTLVEASGKLGGDCLHTGCVPSKSLIAAARVARQSARAAEFGLPEYTAGPVDLARVNAAVRAIIDTIQKHDDPERFRSYGCEVRFGRARFTGPDEIDVDGERISARRFVLATGASPFVPATPGLDSISYQTNETIFQLQQLPSRLAVIGGGPIGIELAQAFARLGSKVTVIQRNPTILPREEPEAAQLLQGRLAGEGVKFLTSVDVQRVESGDGCTRVVCTDKAGGEQAVEVDELLLAVGRTANVEGLGLDKAGVAYDRSRITLDGRLRTTNPRIYACGDVAGPYQFTHMAEYQAGVVLSNAVFRLPKRVDYRVVPWVTYTDPELARVGLSEAEAREQGIPHEVLHFDFSAIDRAIVERETDGFAKFIVRGGSRLRGGGQILGATLVGAHAGELLHEVVLAMQARVPFAKISATIHAYPTLAQINRRTVNSYYGKRLFSPGTRRLVRWINRILP